MSLYHGGAWRVLKQGEFVDVLSNKRHAWRNASGSTASLLLVTTVRMGVFLQQVSTAASTKAAPTQRDQFFELIQEYGYWLGSEGSEPRGSRLNKLWPTRLQLWRAGQLPGLIKATALPPIS